ncbi:MAG: glutathione transferase GstA [Rhodospirillales bacterium]
MKLYYLPGACSLSPHIALREAGIPVELDKVDRATRKTESGKDYLAVNPLGYVPALETPDGRVMREASVIVQWIADQKPAAKLAPPAGTPERYKLQEWLNYISTELHKGTSPLFNPKATDDWKAVVKERLFERYDYASKHLEKNKYLMGDQFTVADGYLFTVLGWTKFVGIDLGKWPVLKVYCERVAQRPAVQAALKAEGLAK